MNGRIVSPPAARPRWLAVLYVGLLGLGFWNTGLDTPWFLKYAIQLFVLGVAVLFWLRTGDHHRLHLTREYFVLAALPFGVMAGWSMLLWALDLQQARYLSRGISTLAYALLALAFACAAGYLFGAKAIDLTFYGMCLANTAIVLESIRYFGPSAFWEGLVVFVRSGGVETSPAIKALEVHDLTFAFGLMLVYYLLYARGLRRVGHALAAALFFLLGFKRIALIALAVVLLAAGLRHLCPARHRAAFARVVGLAGCLGCFFYVYAIRAGLFAYITETFGIDTLGRTQLTVAFADAYTFSPAFRGHGIGWVTRRISLLTAQGIGIFGTHSFGGLHNDLVTLYIELGFWVFAFWLGYSWFCKVRWCRSCCGARAARLLLDCTLYLFVTYTTDNTAFYCYVNTVFLLLPLAEALHPASPNEVTPRNAPPR